MKNRKARKNLIGSKIGRSLYQAQSDRAEEKARAHFERVVEESLDRLPKRVRKALRNLSIIVEDDPDPDLLIELGYNSDDPLLGLYVGVPLPERSFGEEPELPDQILIFRKPLESLYRHPEELREQIRITVVHELAHYFGFDENYLRRLGLD